MSDISGSGPRLPGDKATTGDLQPFPYRIVTDYSQKMMMVTVNGTWEGFVDDSGIIMLVDTLSQPGNSVISFVFTGAQPGATTQATLTQTAPDPSGPYSLALTFIG